MDIQLRSAERRDCEALVGLVGELADFENLRHQVTLSPRDLERHMFGDKPVVECIVAERAGRLVAFALFFVNFSTFLGKPGMYLEDLYVQPAARGEGVGKRLLLHLAQLAVARDYGRFEWSVLDWNANAIAFYQKMGATVMPDWRICRVTGAALQALGAEHDPSA
jgi:GNAT superfamily N-acetyltransferase